MALHGDNESGSGTDGSQDVSAVSQLTRSLQEAYARAGEEMGRQMGAAIVAITTEVASGGGQPGVSAWEVLRAPRAVLALVPPASRQAGTWILLISATAEASAFLRAGTINFEIDLASGHRLIVLR